MIELKQLAFTGKSMRTMALYCLLITCCWAVIGEAADSLGAETLRVTYVIKDAPVWTADGKFAPGILIRLIESVMKIDVAKPLTATHIRVFPKTHALSISATVSQHRKIWELLNGFPAMTDSLGNATPDYAKLVNEQTQLAQSMRKMRTLCDEMEAERLRKLRKSYSIDPGDPTANPFP